MAKESARLPDAYARRSAEMARELVASLSAPERAVLAAIAGAPRAWVEEEILLAAGHDEQALDAVRTPGLAEAWEPDPELVRPTLRDVPLGWRPPAGPAWILTALGAWAMERTIVERGRGEEPHWAEATAEPGAIRLRRPLARERLTPGLVADRRREEPEPLLDQFGNEVVLWGQVVVRDPRLKPGNPAA